MSINSKLEALRLISKELHVNMLTIGLKYLINRKLIELNINGNKLRLRPLEAYSLSLLLSKGWKISKIENNTVELNKEDEDIFITCRVGYGFDLGHLVEIFLENVYNFDIKNKNVVDVGASNGDSSIYFAKKGAKKVIALEPFDESYNLALRNIEKSSVKDKVILFNKALASQKGYTNFYVYENDPNANSTDPENMVKLGKYTTKSVETITLKDIIEMLNGENIGLLKMDCEGCEYSVLNSLDKNAFDKIEAIIMEYHNGLQNLLELLKNNNFQVQVNSSSDTAGYIIAQKNKL